MMLTHFGAAITFMLGLAGLALHRKHLVSALLCIESMVLSLFTSLTLSPLTLKLTTTLTQPVIMLAIAACGACCGLALLVASFRTHGSDHVKTLNLLKY